MWFEWNGIAWKKRHPFNKTWITLPWVFDFLFFPKCMHAYGRFSIRSIPFQWWTKQQQAPKQWYAGECRCLVIAKTVSLSTTCMMLYVLFLASSHRSSVAAYSIFSHSMKSDSNVIFSYKTRTFLLKLSLLISLHFLSLHPARSLTRFILCYSTLSIHFNILV